MSRHTIAVFSKSTKLFAENEHSPAAAREKSTCSNQRDEGTQSALP